MQGLQERLIISASAIHNNKLELLGVENVSTLWQDLGVCRWFIDFLHEQFQAPCSESLPKISCFKLDRLISQPRYVSTI